LYEKIAERFSRTAGYDAGDRAGRTNATADALATVAAH
jgi:hypothetical protein